MMNNKRIFFRFLFGGAAALAAVVLAANFTKITAAPPDDTRMILEHTHRTYISPPCYEQAQKTNHIAESTLGEARTHFLQPRVSLYRAVLAADSNNAFRLAARKTGHSKRKVGLVRETGTGYREHQAQEAGLRCRSDSGAAFSRK